MRWRRPVVIAALVASCAAITMGAGSSCSTATEDRQGPNGRQPDGYQDMTHVIVYRAPDQVPNIAVGCVGLYGFMATLKNSGSSGNGAAAPSLVRFPEYDKVCAS